MDGNIFWSTAALAIYPSNVNNINAWSGKLMNLAWGTFKSHYFLHVTITKVPLVRCIGFRSLESRKQRSMHKLIHTYTNLPISLSFKKRKVSTEMPLLRLTLFLKVMRRTIRQNFYLLYLFLEWTEIWGFIWPVWFTISQWLFHAIFV